MEARFAVILEDTRRHYFERGGMQKKRQGLGRGIELSMYFQSEAGEEEVLWMQVEIPLSAKNRGI
ncbi:Uncharacterised protein [uncultured archaeon]|nr:Uncharacterised protein [uncultured archaeon]